MFKFSSDRISINVDSDYGNSCARHKMPPPLSQSLETHTHTNMKLGISEKKKEMGKEQLSEVDNGCSFFFLF